MRLPERVFWTGVLWTLEIGRVIGIVLMVAMALRAMLCF